MISKNNMKYYIIVAFVSIVLYKIIDSPSQILNRISGFISFFSPFLLGILLTLLLNPLLMFLERRFKTHRLVNIFFSYILITLILSIGFKLLIPAIINTLNTLINEIPYYTNLLNELLNSILSQSEMLETIMPHIQNNLNSILTKLVDLFSRISSDLFIYIFSITSLLFDIIIGIILSIYILYDKEKIILGCKKLLYATFPINKADNIVEFVKVSHNIFYHFIIGQLLDSFIVSILAFIGFQFIVKINNSLFLAFIVFITNIIPYFGPFIGAILPITMTLVYSPIKALWVAIFILILQQLDGNLIGPKIMGDQVGLSPLWIISAVLIGGSAFGIVGVFLSVPVAAIIKYSLDKYIHKKIHIKISK